MRIAEYEGWFNQLDGWQGKMGLFSVLLGIVYKVWVVDSILKIGASSLTAQALESIVMYLKFIIADKLWVLVKLMHQRRDLVV